MNVDGEVFEPAVGLAMWRVLAFVQACDDPVSVDYIRRAMGVLDHPAQARRWAPRSLQPEVRRWLRERPAMMVPTAAQVEKVVQVLVGAGYLAAVPVETGSSETEVCAAFGAPMAVRVYPELEREVRIAHTVVQVLPAQG